MNFDQSLLQLPIRFDPERLAAEVQALPASAWRPHPQGFAGNDAVPLVAPGGADTDEFRGGMGPTPYLLACPYVMAIMAELGGVWGRSRLMGLAAGAQVPLHVDIHYYWRTHIRLHIPIVTNPAVEFTVGGETVNMKPGECWTFNSFKLHEVHNRGGNHRVHLVLDTVGGDRLMDRLQQAVDGVSPPDDPWQPATDILPDLRFEQFNVPDVMSPWEIESHLRFIERQLDNPSQIAPLSPRLARFLSAWQANWARFGDSGAGIADYAELLRTTRIALMEGGSTTIPLANGAPMQRALDALVFEQAIRRDRAAQPAPAEPIAG